MASAAEHELLHDVRWKLQDAPHGLRAAIVAEACAHLNCGQATLYRKLARVGHSSGRKRRSDAGTSVLTLEQLRVLSAVLMASYNRKDQRMPINTALEMVAASQRASGSPWPDVSPSTASRQLYEHRLHPEQLSQPAQSVMLTSLHPNHVWQVDSTTGAFYYMPRGEKLQWMDEAAFNKNKVSNLVRVHNDLLTRYSVADHTTHAFKARYYSGGESVRNLLDFMVWAIWKQDASPMCGAPLILMTDQGPANKSLAMELFCKRLGIEHIMHAPGAARVTGSVEKIHDLERMHFETRFRFWDKRLVDRDVLNDEVERWAAAFCSSRVHRRHGRTRFGGWMEISRYPGALRMPASLEVLREAATTEPVTVRVGNNMRISFKGQPFNLELVPGVIAGLQVQVAMNVYRAPAIDVACVDRDTGEVTWHVVEPEVRTEWQYDGRRVVGQGYQAPAKDELDHNRDAALREAYRTGDALPTLEQAQAMRRANAQAFAGRLDSMADVAATVVPTYLPRRSTLLELPTREVVARTISIVEACKRLREMLGADYKPQIFAALSDAHGTGVPEDALPAIAEQWRSTASQAPASETGLRAIGGGAA